MVSIGKVSINPCGDFDITKSYTRLDLVTYGEIGWICKKACTGVVPSTGNYWQPISSGGSGGQIAVDDTLSDTSTNPVQNKVIKAALDNVHVAVDNALSDTSENPVQNKVVKAAIDAAKADADIVLSDTSTNPVQNKIIKAAIDAKASDMTYNNNILSLLDGKGGTIKQVTISGGDDGDATPSDLDLVWSGTQAQYDAIKDKSILEGMFVNITDA